MELHRPPGTGPVNYSHVIMRRALTLLGECWFLPPSDDSIRRAVVESYAAEQVQQHVEHVSGSIIVDDASFIQRFVVAFWRLCDQRIAAVSRPRDNLPTFSS